MDLRKLFLKRDELMDLYCSFPVGSIDWERCRYELDVIDACIICQMDFDDPEDIALFDEHVDVDAVMQEVFGFTRNKAG